MRQTLIRSCVLGLAATAAFAAVASAADMPSKVSAAPVYQQQPQWSWTGLYIGLNAGYGIGQNNTKQIADPGGVNLVVTNDTLAPNGFVGGAQIGYNWQTSPNWVWGVEADFQGTTQKDNSCTLICGVTAVNTSQEIPWFGTARLRLGYAQASNLWYLTGGAAWAKIDRHNDINIGGAVIETRNFSSTEIGYVLGAGVESHLGGNWTARMEYLYMDFGTLNDTAPSLIIGGLPYDVQSKVRDHVIRLGINYKY
jgi:outer membrane immunogenic protein